MTTPEDAQAQIRDLETQIVRLEAQRRAPLTPTHFLILVFGLILILAFAFIGIRVGWMVTSNPTELGPQVDQLLLVVAIFGNPVSAVIGALAVALSNITGGD
jgi:nitrate reductase NapE component|tara:strand:- start:96 stop:401 length:306 start_codon:yes stop_codon:yes gene_type:complete